MGVEGDSGSSLDAVLKIVAQLLVPFVAGQLVRRWIGTWVARNARWLKRVDQGSILLVVYTAFSDAVVSGLWHAVPPSRLLGLALVCCLLLAVVLWLTSALGRWLGFNLEDRAQRSVDAYNRTPLTGCNCAGAASPSSSRTAISRLRHMASRARSLGWVSNGSAIWSPRASRPKKV
ncbi:hypothetical protein D3C85_1095650 [compost metagenome]